MMSFEEFQEKVIKTTQKRFSDYDIRSEHVEKAHHDSYEGMLVKPKNSNTGFTINLNAYYEDYQKMSFEVVIAGITRAINETLPTLTQLSLPDFTDYEAVKDKMNIRLVSNHENGELVQKAPHIDHGEFSEVCYIEFPYFNGRIGATLLTEDMFSNMKNAPSEEQLFKNAIVQTQKNYPLKISGLGALIHRMAADQGIDIPEENFEDRTTLVVSNTEGYHGAAAVFYPGVLETAAERLEGSYFMIPSSIHEFLFMKDTGQGITEINSMIRDVNETEVAPEDRLSDHALYYDAETQKIETDREYIARTIFEYASANTAEDDMVQEISKHHRQGRILS